MLKIWEYENLSSQNTPLTLEEQTSLNEFQNLIKNARKYYEDITSNDLEQLITSYNDYITKLSILPKEQQNANIIATLNANKAIMDETSPKLTDDQTLSLKQTTASQGFTNASIIIFVVLLLGTILAVILLSLA